MGAASAASVDLTHEQMDERGFPPGTIGVLVGSDLARYHQFTLAMVEMWKPKGSTIHWARDLSIPMGLNQAIQSMPPEHEWVWLMGDDHYFQPDILYRMLWRAYDVGYNLPILAPLCFTHSAPFNWTMRYVDEDGKLKPFPADKVPSTGVLEVHACGSAGMLIQREVLDRMPPPWFRNTHPFVPNEDIDFCLRARDLGFATFVDLELPLGHVGTKLVIPHYHEERHQWGVQIDLGNEHVIWSDKINIPSQ